MNIYILNISLLIFYMLVNQLIKDKRSFNREKTKNKRSFLFLELIFLQMWLILSLRHWTVGTDTISYKLGFEIADNIKVWQIIDLSQEYLMFNFEKGFILLTVIVNYFTDNFNIYLSLISLIILIPVYTTIKKFSVMPLLSVFLYITLNFFHFSMSGIRQAIAISLILLSYKYLIKDNKLKFLITILIASTFHLSSLFFLITIFLRKFKFNLNKIIIYFVSLIPIFIFKEQIYSIVTTVYFGVEKSSVETGAYTLFLVVILVFIGALVFYKPTINKNIDTILLYNIVAIAPVLMIFNSVSQSSLRLANYFYIFIILLIPEVFKSLKVRERYIASACLLIACLSFYFIYGNKFLGTREYLFFW